MSTDLAFIGATQELAYFIWQARYGSRAVDAETTQEIMDTAQNYCMWREGPPVDIDMESVGRRLAAWSATEAVEPLGVTHQDIADEAYRLYQSRLSESDMWTDEHGFSEEHEQQLALKEWIEAQNIMQARGYNRWRG